jgi:hypothetical protein
MDIAKHGNGSIVAKNQLFKDTAKNRKSQSIISTSWRTRNDLPMKECRRVKQVHCKSRLDKAKLIENYRKNIYEAERNQKVIFEDVFGFSLLVASYKAYFCGLKKKRIVYYFSTCKP